MAFVLPTETFKDAVLVLPNSLTQVACHPGVQSARNACDHVHEIVALSHAPQLTVIPTKSDDSLADHPARGGTRCSLDLREKQVPRLRRSSASRTIFFARDDRVIFISKCTPQDRPVQSSSSAQSPVIVAHDPAFPSSSRSIPCSEHKVVELFCGSYPVCF